MLVTCQRLRVDMHSVDCEAISLPSTVCIEWSCKFAEGRQKIALLHPDDSDESGEASLLAQSLLPFCFPLGQYSDSSEPGPTAPHYFVVSDSEGEQKHGFCRPISVVCRQLFTSVYCNVCDTLQAR